jgi:hypothetical protein
MASKKPQNPLVGRIKRMMRADDDVGKVAKATPVVIGEGLNLPRSPPPAHISAPGEKDGLASFPNTALPVTQMQQKLWMSSSSIWWTDQ